MLDFILFIVLLSVIMGVSFTTALTGFIKFVAIAVAIVVAIALILKLLESKNGSWFVLVASLISLTIGVNMIKNANLDDFQYCDKVSPSYMLYCSSEVVRAHDEMINRGWGYAIVGGLTTFFSCVALSSFYTNKTDDEEPAKAHSVGKN